LGRWIAPSCETYSSRTCLHEKHFVLRSQRGHGCTLFAFARHDSDSASQSPRACQTRTSDPCQAPNLLDRNTTRRASRRRLALVPGSLTPGMLPVRSADHPPQPAASLNLSDRSRLATTVPLAPRRTLPTCRSQSCPQTDKQPPCLSIGCSPNHALHASRL
jgi:hypothetical protein